jgi:hypothetical protein
VILKIVCSLPDGLISSANGAFNYEAMKMAIKISLSAGNMSDDDVGMYVCVSEEVCWVE